MAAPAANATRAHRGPRIRGPRVCEGGCPLNVRVPSSQCRRHGAGPCGPRSPRHAHPSRAGLGGATLGLPLPRPPRKRVAWLGALLPASLRPLLATAPSQGPAGVPGRGNAPHKVIIYYSF